jgi:hypothetical protein
MGTTLLLAALLLGAAPPRLLEARGPYLGQPLPGERPALFAPGVVNVGLACRDVALSPDGTELYFTVFLPHFSQTAICWTRQIRGRWTAPEVVPFAQDPRWRTLEPFVSPDGQRLFFSSDRPADPGAQAPGPFGLWVATRDGAGWSAPRRLPGEINEGGEAFFASMTRSGTLYFLQEDERGRRILRARPRGDGFAKAEPLPPPLNLDPGVANPFVDPDERMLLFPVSRRKDSLGGSDYYASFQREDAGWTAPVHLEAPVSSEDAEESSITLSPDGRVVFFGSARLPPGGLLGPGPMTFTQLEAQRTRPGNGHSAIWWVDSGFLARARQRALAEGSNP